MSEKLKVFLILVALAAFATLEIYLFNNVAQWIPWTIFLVVFVLALVFGSPFVGGLVRAPFNTKPTQAEKNPLEPLSAVQDNSSKESDLDVDRNRSINGV